MAELTRRFSSGLRLSQQQLEVMRADVESKAPEEGCGMLAGEGEQILLVLPITNDIHSPVRYHMDPYEQLRAFQQIDGEGLELLGIYHSHPAGPEVPSRTDIAEAFYPEVVYLIWYKSNREWLCRGYEIRDGIVAEVDLHQMNG